MPFAYIQRGTKPLGVFADVSTGMVTIVKRDGTSYLRPTHAAEHLYLTASEYCYPEQLEAIPRVGEGRIPFTEVGFHVMGRCNILRNVWEGLAYYMYEVPLRYSCDFSYVIFVSH